MAAAGYKALLIGNSTFPMDSHNLQPLAGPVNDVSALRAALTDAETGLFAAGAVRLVAERTTAEILVELETFFRAGRREDVLLLYWSGHGLLDETGQLYLAARDTRTDLLKSTAVSASSINAMFADSAAQTTIIVLDCCHSGAFKSGDLPASLRGTGRFLLTSCRGAQLANDASAQNGTSAFTGRLIEALQAGATDRDHDGFITLDDVYDYVHDRLAADGRQIPQRRFEGGGEIAIAARPAAFAGGGGAGADPETRIGRYEPVAAGYGAGRTSAGDVPLAKSQAEWTGYPGGGAQMGPVRGAGKRRGYVALIAVAAIVAVAAAAALGAMALMSDDDSPPAEPATPAEPTTPGAAGATATPTEAAAVLQLTPISGAGARDGFRLNMEACNAVSTPVAPRSDLRCGDKVSIAGAECLDLRHYPSAVTGVASDGKRYFGTRITSVCARDGTFTLGSDPVFTEGAIWLNLFLSPQVNGWVAAGPAAQAVKLVERSRGLPFQLPCQGTRAPEGFACGDRVRVSAAAPGSCLEMRHYPTTFVGVSEGKQYFGVLIANDVLCKGNVEGVVATDPYGSGNDFWLNVKVNEQLEGWVNTGPSRARHLEIVK